MKVKFRRAILRVMLLTLVLPLVLSTLVVGANPQWPTRPINVYVQFSAGGTTDVVVRVIAGEMSKFLGQPIAIINMPAAGGAAATRLVLDSPSDGYTMLGFSSSYGRHSVLGLGDYAWYDFYNWLAASDTVSIAVRSNSPYKDLNQLMDDLAKKGGRISFAHAGIGTAQHLATEVFMNVTGLQPNVVPYPGGNPATVSAIGGETDVVVSKLPEQAEYLRAGRLRSLASFTSEPVMVSGYGEIPPITEFVPDMATYLPGLLTTFGPAVKRDTPGYIVKRINDAFLFAVEQESVKQQFDRLNIVTQGLTGDEADQMFSKTVSISSWLMWDVEATQHSPAEFNIPKIEAWTWPPSGHPSRSEYIPWPAL